MKFDTIMSSVGTTMSAAAAAILYTDGACSPNPGHCGAGAVLLIDGAIAWTLSEYISPKGTNNIGELAAIVRGLQRAREMRLTRVTIYSDSELSVHLLNGRKSTTKEHLLMYVHAFQKLKAHFDKVEVRWVKGHADNAWNNVADKLATQAVASAAHPTTMSSRPSTAAAAAIIHLNCPFAEKDDAKALGAKWDMAKKKWTVADTPENRLTFARWL